MRVFVGIGADVDDNGCERSQEVGGGCGGSKDHLLLTDGADKLGLGVVRLSAHDLVLFVVLFLGVSTFGASLGPGRPAVRRRQERRGREHVGARRALALPPRRVLLALHKFDTRGKMCG